MPSVPDLMLEIHPVRNDLITEGLRRENDVCPLTVRQEVASAMHNRCTPWTTWHNAARVRGGRPRWIRAGAADVYTAFITTVAMASFLLVYSELNYDPQLPFLFSFTRDEQVYAAYLVELGIYRNVLFRQHISDLTKNIKSLQFLTLTLEEGDGWWRQLSIQPHHIECWFIYESMEINFRWFNLCNSIQLHVYSGSFYQHPRAWPPR